MKLAELKGADFAAMAEIVRQAKDSCGVEHAILVAGQWSYPAYDLVRYCEWDRTGEAFISFADEEAHERYRDRCS